MFEHDEVVLEAKHVTRRFPASDGRILVANDDINLKFYKVMPEDSSYFPWKS